MFTALKLRPEQQTIDQVLLAIRPGRSLAKAKPPKPKKEKKPRPKDQPRNYEKGVKRCARPLGNNYSR